MTRPLPAQFHRVNLYGSLGEALPVQYNPTEFTLNKGIQIAEVAIPGLDSPILQFVRGQTETLSLELFFDTTEEGGPDEVKSVTERTDKFYRLIKMDGELHAPPVLFFSWGEEFPGRRSYSSIKDQGTSGAPDSTQRHGFKCIVESVRQRFTFFSPEGVPLRATLTVSLREYKTLSEQIQQGNPRSPDHSKAHVVQQGETLSRIAARVYGSPAEWRHIAEHNAIEDPLDLPSGLVLEIPPIA